MLTDRYGLPVTTTSQAARDAYVTGTDCLLAGIAGVQQHLERALTADPGFALAHVALARGLFLRAEVAPARGATARARELAAKVTEGSSAGPPKQPRSGKWTTARCSINCLYGRPMRMCAGKFW